MMAREGIGQEEMDKMEVNRVGCDEIFQSNREVFGLKETVHLYECPICNDTSANTANDLMGMMVLVQCDAGIEDIDPY